MADQIFSRDGAGLGAELKNKAGSLPAAQCNSFLISMPLAVLASIANGLDH
jgi:hypothetical protein